MSQDKKPMTKTQMEYTLRRIDDMRRKALEDLSQDLVQINPTVNQLRKMLKDGTLKIRSDAKNSNRVSTNTYLHSIFDLDIYSGYSSQLNEKKCPKEFQKRKEIIEAETQGCKDAVVLGDCDAALFALEKLAKILNVEV